MKCRNPAVSRPSVVVAPSGELLRPGHASGIDGTHRSRSLPTAWVRFRQLAMAAGKVVLREIRFKARPVTPMGVSFR